MKKILSCGIKVFFISILFSLSFFLKANAQEANIYIPTLKVEKPQYIMGETVKGEFGIDNNANVRQSDVLIKFSTFVKNSKGVILVDEKSQDTLYLEANSRRVVPFSYELPKDITGQVDLVVQAFSGDGAILGMKNTPIFIQGNTTKNIVGIDDSYILIGKDKFQIQNGPTVEKKGDISLEYIFGSSTQKFSAKPILTLYNRTDNSEPLKVIPQATTSFKAGEVYKIKLPTDLDPLVYAGKITFESADNVVSPIYFRYIIKGDIGTILNANTDVLSGEKGDVVNVKVSYAGTPVAINIAKDTGSNSTSTIIATLYNESGKSVGVGETEVNLSNVGDVVIPINLTEKTNKIYISAKMKNGDRVISEYKLQLPTEEEISNAYGKKKNFNLSDRMLMGIDVLLSLILIALLLIYKKNNNKILLAVSVIVVALIAVLLAYQRVRAFELLYSPQANASQYFTVNAIFSPGPSTSVSYAPGESFDFSIAANFVACTNNLAYFYVYGPAKDWYKYSTSSYSYLNAMGGTGDYAAGSILNQIASWKNMGGDLTFAGLEWGVYSDWASWANNVKSGNTLSDLNDPPMNWVRGSRLDTSAGGHEYSYYYSQINGAVRFPTSTTVRQATYHPSVKIHDTYTEPYYTYSTSTINAWGVEKYKMPTTPGKYNFVFFLWNQARGNTQASKIVSQEVCVRGAGLCVDEAIQVSVCPNLIGMYTLNDGVIYDSNNVATNYSKDSLGNCVVNICAPNPMPANYGNSCGCADTGVVGTVACDGTCKNSSGVTIPFDCSKDNTLDFVCQASPVAKNQNVQFVVWPIKYNSTEINSSLINAGNVTFNWQGGSPTCTVETNACKINGGYPNDGVYTKDVSITYLDKTTVGSCTVQVGCTGTPGIDQCSSGSVWGWRCNGSSWVWEKKGDCPDGNITPSSMECSPSLDGVTLKEGEEKDFYSSRIAKECSYKTAHCTGGNLIDKETGEDFESDIFKYKKCVVPDFNEF